MTLSVNILSPAPPHFPGPTAYMTLNCDHFAFVLNEHVHLIDFKDPNSNELEGNQNVYIPYSTKGIWRSLRVETQKQLAE